MFPILHLLYLQSKATIQNIQDIPEGPFSLFKNMSNICNLIHGILLFSREKYPDLYNAINGEYTYINGGTGDYFYLWTSVSPENISIETDRELRPWINSPDAYDALFCDACEKSLGLELSDAPILVLSTNVDSRRVLVVELNGKYNHDADCLHQLVRDISKFARETRNGEMSKYKLDQLKDVVDRYGLPNRIQSIPDATFGDTIKIVFANIVQSPAYRKAARVNPSEFHKAVQVADREFDSLNRKIFNLRQDLLEIDEKEEFESFIACRDSFEQLCYKQLLSVAMRTTEVTNLERFGLSLNIEKFLLPGSRDYFNSALRALSIRELFHGDESPITIGFAKMFENEINNSVVQEMRQECGVRMPEFFGKFDPQAGPCPMVNGEMTVKMNAAYNHQCWLPPEMGRSRKVYKACGMTLSNKGQFITLWNDIARSRNICAHAGHSDEQCMNLENMIKYIRSMEEQSFWQELCNIRKKLFCGQ